MQRAEIWTLIHQTIAVTANKKKKRKKKKTHTHMTIADRFRKVPQEEVGAMNPFEGRLAVVPLLAVTM